jgi:hypothetical protein
MLFVEQLLLLPLHIYDMSIMAEELSWPSGHSMQARMFGISFTRKLSLFYRLSSGQALQM